MGESLIGSTRSPLRKSARLIPIRRRYRYYYLIPSKESKVTCRDEELYQLKRLTTKSPKENEDQEISTAWVNHSSMLSGPNEYTYIADTLKQEVITRHAESEGRVCTIGGRREYPEVGGKR